MGLIRSHAVRGLSNIVLGMLLRFVPSLYAFKGHLRSQVTLEKLRETDHI